MNIIERIDRPCEYVEVAQTALIACQYLYLWLFAGPDDAYKVYSAGNPDGLNLLWCIRDFLWQLCLLKAQYGCYSVVWAFCICIWAFNAGGGLYNHYSLPCNCAQQNAFRFFQCQ